MTIKELRELLAEYPENAKVFVLRERKAFDTGGTMMDIEPRWIIDQDSNEGSVCLHPSEISKG